MANSINNNIDSSCYSRQTTTKSTSTTQQQITNELDDSKQTNKQIDKQTNKNIQIYLDIDMYIHKHKTIASDLQLTDVSEVARSVTQTQMNAYHRLAPLAPFCVAQLHYSCALAVGQLAPVSFSWLAQFIIHIPLSLCVPVDSSKLEWLARISVLRCFKVCARYPVICCVVLRCVVSRCNHHTHCILSLCRYVAKSQCRYVNVSYVCVWQLCSARHKLLTVVHDH